MLQNINTERGCCLDIMNNATNENTCTRLSERPTFWRVSLIAHRCSLGLGGIALTWVGKGGLVILRELYECQ